MPKLTQSEIRQNAVEFVHEWKDERSEHAESQSFWNHFFTGSAFPAASFEDGNLLLTDEERAEILARESTAEKFISSFVSASEFINGENR